MINDKSAQNLPIKSNSLDHESAILTWTLVGLIVVFSAFLVLSYKPDPLPVSPPASTTNTLAPAATATTGLSPSNVTR